VIAVPASSITNAWRDYGTAAGLLQVRHYYRPPGLPRHKQWWLATVCRKGKVRHTSRAKRVWRRRLGCGCLENGSPKASLAIRASLAKANP
jgi:hypothetical protein